MGYFLALIFVAGVFAFFMYHVLTNLIYICSPSEVLVFSGGRHATAQGIRGYKIVKGGRALRIPFLEEVSRLDLTNMNIDVAVRGGFSKGGIPLNIEGIANVKVAGESPGLDNALQRLLGKPRPLIMKIAKETIEGYLRGVLATLTPEEVNENTQAFEKELRAQAGEGFVTLGLTLDNLKIQSITDDQGYLAAIGRVQGAELNRDNRIAEAHNRAESLVEQADARRKGELAKIDAEFRIVEAETERRVQNAETQQHAWVAQEEGEVKALLTRAQAEMHLQEARIAQMKHQLEAEIVTPARADMEAKIAEARGDAAPILERGRAQAEALTKLADQWKQSGSSAKDIFLLQKLDVILPTFLASIDRVRIDNVTMLQGLAGGNGSGGSFPGQAVATVKALEAGGIDVPGLLNRLVGDEPKARKRSTRTKLRAPEDEDSRATMKLAQATPPAQIVPPPPRPAPVQKSSRQADLLGVPQQAVDQLSDAKPPRARLIRKRSR